MTEIEEERLAHLLTVVADIDPGRDLLAHDVAGGGLAEGVDGGFVHDLPDGASRIERGQRGGPGQAARVGGQDPVLASQHGRIPSIESASWHCRRPLGRFPALSSHAQTDERRGLEIAAIHSESHQKWSTNTRLGLGAWYRKVSRGRHVGSARNTKWWG